MRSFRYDARAILFNRVDFGFLYGRDQRVGDLVAGTVVVRERETEAPAFAQVFAAAVSDPALRRSFEPVEFTADLSELTESEIQVVETFLRRRWDLQNIPRQWMAWRVSFPSCTRSGPVTTCDLYL